MVRRLTAVVAALLLAAGVTACGSSGSKNAGGGASTTVAGAALDPTRAIRLASTSPPPTSWDPATTTSTVTQLVRYYNAVYDTLLRIDADNRLEPQLATKWSYDATKTVLTLTLRSGVTFSDGAAFDASVAKLNLDRVRNGTSPNARLLAGITSIDAKSATELVITQTASNPRLLFGLALPAASMVSPLVLRSNPASLNQKPVGTGPYTLGSATALTATLIRNDHYWDKSVKFPARQEITATIDPNARMNALMSGTVDFMQLGGLPPSADLLARVKSGQFTARTQAGTAGLLGINTKIPPLDNPKVVEAINDALDRDQINQAIYNGQCKPTGQVFMPGQPGYIDGLTYKYDLTKAQQLMTEAGVGKVTIELQTVAGGPTAPAELFASMLAKIGITLKIVPSPPQVAQTNFYAGKYAMSLLAIFLVAPDSSFVTDYLTGPFNPGTKDPALVKLVDTANAMTVDDPGRAKAYEAVNRYAFDHSVVVPTCQIPNAMYAVPDVVGMDKIPMADIGNMDTTLMGMKAK